MKNLGGAICSTVFDGTVVSRLGLSDKHRFKEHAAMSWRGSGVVRKNVDEKHGTYQAGDSAILCFDQNL